jgi:arylsulfatase A-like enzyme
MPFSLLFQFGPVNARSVPFLRVILYCSGVSCFFHSSSDFTTFVVIELVFAAVGAAFVRSAALQPLTSIAKQEITTVLLHFAFCILHLIYDHMWLRKTQKRPANGRGIGIWCFLGVWVLVCGVSAAPRPANPLADRIRRDLKPNIIFILADDLGYGDLGCYGQKKIKTPNLDRMAAEGMRFTQCYAGSTVCAPSRSVLMTGQHTGHTRIRGNAAYPLRPEDITVAEVLKQAGYKTGVFGKWGMGLPGTTGTPSKQGFDDWYGYLSQTHAHDYYPTQLWRSSTLHGVEDLAMAVEKNLNGNKGVYAHDLFSKTGSNFVRTTKYFSFFLYLPYTIPHANNELGKKTGNGMEVPNDKPYSDEDWPQPEKNKAAMITRLDADVGALMDYLKKLKIETNTVIFFTSDNGPHKEGGVDPKFFNSSGSVPLPRGEGQTGSAGEGRGQAASTAPLRGIKRDMYEGGIRVPMIVWWPGKIKPGTVSDQVWAFWDFLPTAAEIAGAKPPDNIDGISILPTLLGRPQTNQHEFLYWEFHEKGSKQAVRTGDWKAVRLAPAKPLELYNLKTDPSEAVNVAASHPDVIAKIETSLKTARTESDRWPIKTPAEADKEKPTAADTN